MPTFLEEQSAAFNVTFPLDTMMDDAQVSAFEIGTAEWLETIDLTRGRILKPVVHITRQLIAETTQVPAARRHLLVSAPAVIKRELQVEFNVTGTYVGVDSSFDLHFTMYPEFTYHNTLWLRALAKQDSSFVSLNPVLADLAEMERQKQLAPSKGTRMSSLVAVLMAAIVATALGVAAAVYSIHSYRKNVTGREMNTPHSSFGNEVTSAKKLSSRPSLSFDGSVMSKSIADWSAMSVVSSKLVSPNSLERGVSVRKRKESGFWSKPDAFDSVNHVRSDPPSGISNGLVSSYAEPRALPNSGRIPYLAAQSTSHLRRDIYRETPIFDNTVRVFRCYCSKLVPVANPSSFRRLKRPRLPAM
jgi:cell division protein FtsL